MLHCCEAPRSMISNYFCKKQVLRGTFGEILCIQMQKYPKTYIELKYGACYLNNEVSAHRLGLVVHLSWRVAPPFISLNSYWCKLLKLEVPVSSVKKVQSSITPSKCTNTQFVKNQKNPEIPYKYKYVFQYSKYMVLVFCMNFKRKSQDCNYTKLPFPIYVCSKFWFLPKLLCLNFLALSYEKNLRDILKANLQRKKEILVTIFYNKDHQRMMVDPMLMIVKSLMSFLTAVTTTAVAPTAIIYLYLTEFTWIYLNLPELT